MPNFDGNGPLKRGWGRGSCRQDTEDYPRKDTGPEILTKNETPEQQPY
jgi:hypothetical protein